jgi:hypothetical protein
MHFALNTGDDCKIYTLDLPRDAAARPRLPTTAMDQDTVRTQAGFSGYYFENTKTASKIHCLYEDSAAFDFAPFRGAVDLFFIDGAHSYEYVRSDTLNALACTHEKSVIAWHDFGRVGVNGVSKWLIELSKEFEIFSIPGGSLAFMVVK